MSCYCYLALFHLVWGVGICFYLNRLFKGGALDYILKEDEEIAKKYTPFRRTDIKHWRQTEMYICGIFLLPYRIVFTLVMSMICGVICWFLTIGCDLRKELDPFRRSLIRFFTFIFPRAIFFSWGFYWIEKKTHRIVDLDPDYKEVREPPLTAPIIASNHVSFLDIFYFLVNRYSPGFLSKASIAKVPFVGTIAKARQSIFVERTDRTQKDAVLLDIKGRVDKSLSGQNFPPIVIYPEGTTADGKSIITFKKGAFFSFAPIRIIVLEYPKESFSPAYDNLDFLVILIGLLCQSYNRIRVNDCGIYDPAYLNLKEEGDWVKYASRVRGIMAKCINVPMYELGYEDKMKYFAYGLELKKQLAKGGKIEKKQE